MKAHRLAQWITLGCLAVSGSSVTLAQQSKPGKLEQTLYYSGDIHGSPHSFSAIDVDRDGTVGLGIQRSKGAWNFELQNDTRSVTLLFDKDGEPAGQISAPVAGINDVSFGPDARIYTAEGWFGSGSHVYDRPGARERYVPKRKLVADGSHVDKGSPASVAVDEKFQMYTVLGTKLSILSAEDKLIKQVDGAPNNGRVNVTANGTVYVGAVRLEANDAWTKLRCDVKDVSPDGNLLLVGTGAGWLVIDPRKADVAAAIVDKGPGDLLALAEKKVTLPPGNWGDAAIGANGNVFLSPQRDPGLGYVEVNPADGSIVRQRGADFDRITVLLPTSMFTSGQPTKIQAQTIRSRTLGYVPESQQLPQDNRRELKLRAAISPQRVDPLVERVWTTCDLQPKAEGEYALTPPADAFGAYDLRIAATPEMPGTPALEVTAPVEIRPNGAVAQLSLLTDRGRIGFAPGTPVRVAVKARAFAGAADLSHVSLVLSDTGPYALPVWSTPLNAGTLDANSENVFVIIIPTETTAYLKPGAYHLTCAALPASIGCERARIDILDPVARSDFETVFHPIGESEMNAANARTQASMGASHTSVYFFAQYHADEMAYMDAAGRLGFTYHRQPHSHFAALHSLPDEQGAARQFWAYETQRRTSFPAFTGFNYHDLWAPFTTWWDAPRKDAYPPLWKEWGAAITPATPNITGDARDKLVLAYGKSATLPRLYESWGDVIRRASPRELQRTTMQWWHMELQSADPDTVATNQDLIATQHMEEQYYHPATVANQVDLWRRPGMPLWCYGNAAFQEDGSGAETYRELMAGWSRGVQGLGRNFIPKADNAWSERIHRIVEPMYRILAIYGSLSAASEPDDQVAVWRSLFQEASEDSNRPVGERHLFNTAGAYVACLYAHRTATMITDGKVRAGDLKKYKAVIISFEHEPPADLRDRLAEFQSAGGIVLANKPAKGYWVPKGAVEIGELFRDTYLSYHHNEDIDRWWRMDREEGIERATKLRQALGDSAKPIVETDDPATWLSVLASGDARYVFATNLNLLPIEPAHLHRYAAFQNTARPALTRLRLDSALAGMAVFDVLRGRRVEPREGIVDADMTVIPGAVLAFLPRAVEAVRVESAQWPDRSYLDVQANVLDDKGAVINAAVPLEITLTDEKGQARYTLHRTTRGGAWRESLPIAANDAAGAWTIEVRELLAGNATAGVIDVATPEMPGAAPPQSIEVARKDAAKHALASAKTVAIVVEADQAADVSPAVDAVKKSLAGMGKQVREVTTKDYLADRVTFGWDKFQFAQYQPEVKPRPKRYDLIVTFDLPGKPSKVVLPEVLAIRPADGFGRGRGAIQYVVIPVYDTEDAISLAGGDAEGLRLAAESLAKLNTIRDTTQRAAAPVAPSDLKLQPLLSKPRGTTPPVLSDFIGIPAAEVVVSDDSKHVAVAMRGWGNNLFVLDTDSGEIVGRDVCGKFYPLRLQAMDDGFSVLQHEIDPTVLYTKVYDWAGKASHRFAAAGRRLYGTGAVSVSHPNVIPSMLAQASFSLTPDGRFAAVAGSKGLAVWDVRNQKIMWRDDAVHHEPGETGVAQHPQVAISPDGSRLALQHRGKMEIRDGQTGKVLNQITLPLGSEMGPARVFDGSRLVIGDAEFFGFRDGKVEWRWKAPADQVTASDVAADGLHYAIGQPSGALRLMNGGGQTGGVVVPSGGILSVDISADGAITAYASSTGHVGVVKSDGSPVWRGEVGCRASIALLGDDGGAIVTDWRGRVHRFDASGQRKLLAELTPQVYREDLAQKLTTLDDTPTLRLSAPKPPESIATQNRKNLAPAAQVQLNPAKTSGWQRPIATQKDGGAPVNNGKPDDLTKPWFDVSGVNYMVGMEYQFPLTWELTWTEPQTIDSLVVHESAQHPDAVPEEIAIEAWIEEGDWKGWKRLVHTRWNSGVVHGHEFDAVKTAKLRYLVYGDFGNNLWTSEIEAYGK